MVTRDLIQGKKIVIACEVRGCVEVLASLLRSAGYRVLDATRYTKNSASFEKLLKSPDEALNGYDVLIYSPVIQSGISIEKSGFDKGYFIGNGSAITGNDAGQMVCRCRDVKDWVAVLSPNRYTYALSEEQLQKEMAVRASYGEVYTDFARAVEQNEQWRSVERSDFARFFLWGLSFNGWKIERIDAEKAGKREKSEVNEKFRELTESEIETITYAKPFHDDMERRDFQFKKNKTFEDEARLIRDDIAQWLGVQDITEQDVWLFCNKQGIWCIDNVRALYGLVTDRERQDKSDVAIREQVIQETGIGKGFVEGRFTKDEAKARNKYRCSEGARFVLSALGLMSPKYGRIYKYSKKEAIGKEKKLGAPKPMPLPHHPVREMFDEMESFGAFKMGYRWDEKLWCRKGMHNTKYDRYILNTKWKNHLLELAKYRYQVLQNEEEELGQNGVFSYNNSGFCPNFDLSESAQNDNEIEESNPAISDAEAYPDGWDVSKGCYKPTYRITNPDDVCEGKQMPRFSRWSDDDLRGVEDSDRVGWSFNPNTGKEELATIAMHLRRHPLLTQKETIIFARSQLKDFVNCYYDRHDVYEDDIEQYNAMDVPMDIDDDCVAGGVIDKGKCYEVRSNVHTSDGIHHKKMDFLKTELARKHLFKGDDTDFPIGISTSGNYRIGFVGSGDEKETKDALFTYFSQAELKGRKYV